MDKMIYAVGLFINDTYRNSVGEHIENVTCAYDKNRSVELFEYDLFSSTHHLNFEHIMLRSSANPIYNSVSMIQNR